jgi:16S rRNA (cytidine1402-2'-O)-methyltransferase
MVSSKKRDKKIETSTTGCLYVVATPIGNLDDITLRAIRVLETVDMIAAEDTRHTKRLLTAHGIHNRLISYHEHNEAQRSLEIMEKIRTGRQIALVTDAGTPMVADPGYRLVQAAIADDVQVIPVPGVSAATAALCASGMATDQFSFLGFPSRKKTRRIEALKAAARLPGTLIFYQSPRRILTFLDEVLSILGDRHAVLARELTKVHEEFIRGPLTQIKTALAKKETIKGECTLLVEGHSRDLETADGSWEKALLSALEADSRPISDVAKEIAHQFGVKKREVYNKAMQIRKK